MVQCCDCGGADDQRKCRHTGYCKSKECSFQKENPVGIKKIQGGTDTGYLSVPDEPVKDSGFQSLCKRKLCMLYKVIAAYKKQNEKAVKAINKLYK